jgi:hypothetical protein
MITRIEYGEYWSDYYQGWRYPYSEAEARRRHEARELYTALIEQHDGLLLALELCFAFSYCNIYFLDAQGRCDLRYTFEPTDDSSSVRFPPAHMREIAASPCVAPVAALLRTVECRPSHPRIGD